MAITIDDFNKIWASTSPLTPYTFSDANYKQGWNFVGNTPPSRQMWDSWLKMTDEKCQYLYNHEDVPIGHEYFTFNPNIPQGSLPLFGGEYSRETYADLWNWVQQQAGYLKTEAEWQTLATANNGNVPFYSDGDGSTTFRVPSLKCWVKSANGTVTEVGSYLEAGLPNVNGAVSFRALTASANLIFDTSGPFTVSKGDNAYNTIDTTSQSKERETISFDTSRSSAIYGNSTTVQPESIVGMWLVKAYGVIVDTGTINEQQYIDDRIAALPTSLATTFLPLAGGTMTGTIVGNPLTLSADDGNDSADLVLNPSGSATWAGKEVERVNASGTDYIRYESGLQICWNRVSSVTTSGKAETFPMAFDSTPRLSVATASNAVAIGFTSLSTTGVTFKSASGTQAIDYIAVGYWK